MAKELPYFKFEPNQWENGNIQICNRELKGFFMDLCSMYWSRLGDLPFQLAAQKLCGGNATALNSLCDHNIIAVEDEFIRIDFLEEQLLEFGNTSKKNSQNAKDGWRKRREIKSLSEKDAAESKSQSESDAIREDKIREEEIRKEEKRLNDILLAENPKFQEIVEIFHSVCKELPIVSEITQDRKRAILEIESKYGLEKIGIVFQLTSQSDYLNGKVNNWKASFDWILNPKNFLKILENNYKNNGQTASKKGEYAASDELKEKIANRLFAKELS